MKILKKMKNKKGFTLIELLTVIAILGTLVLLAAPKFLGYTEKANLIKMQTNIKTIEAVVDLSSLQNENYIANWIEIPEDDLNELNSSGKIINKKGEIIYNLEGGKQIPEKLVETSVNDEGFFILGNDNEVYLYKEDFHLADTGIVNPDGSITHPNGDITKPDGIKILADGSGLILKDGITFVPMAKDSDFTGTNGSWKYIGKENSIVLPNVIHGTLVTDATLMFNNTSVKRVVLLENSITNMYSMFSNSQATELDLSEFDTSNVTNMNQMFLLSQAEKIDLRGFNTSKTTDMTSMFNGSQVTTLDLSGFDTSNVFSMSSMFHSSQVKNINVSNFVTSNVITMHGMFTGSQAITLDLSSFDVSNVKDTDFMFTNSNVTTGYARTEDDALKLNSSFDKPSKLTFVVK